MNATRAATSLLVFTLCCTAFGATDASAGEALANRGNEADSLLTVVRFLQSDIATRAVVQDVDEAPGLVQVFTRAELEAKGARTIDEALAYVPGIDVPIDNLGVRQPLIRGFGGILSGATGKVKYLLNGVPFNSTQSATGSAILQVPVAQVERIEIIRGPGSAVYGEHAFLGVVNVITRDEGRSVSLRHGSHGTVTGAGSFSYTTPSGTNVSFNAAGWRGDGADSRVDEDPLFALGQQAISNAPGPANEYGENHSAMLEVEHGGFSFLAQYIDQGQGDYFGALNLPPAQSREVFSNRWWTIEAKQLVVAGPQTEWRFKAGLERFRNHFDDVEISPPGFLGIYPDGQVATTNYEEERRYAGAEVVWSGWKRQTWLFGVEYASVENFESYSDQNFDTGNPIPGTPFPAPLPEERRFRTILDEGQSRRIGSVYLQDHIDLTDRVAVTAGARFDDYSDAGNTVTPRLAGVFRLNDRHILKAQYAEAFRPPTFVEWYSTAEAARGDRDLEPETVRTTELGYVYRNRSTVFRATLFHSDFDDLIVSEERQFVNARGARVRGADLEIENRFNDAFKIAANLSLVDTEDKVTGRPLEGSADIIANLELIYQPQPQWSVDLNVRYVDERHRAPDDLRAPIDSYATADVTISRFNPGYSGLTLRFGVRNMFDEMVTDPAPANTYADDYPRPGRTYFAQLSLDF